MAYRQYVEKRKFRMLMDFEKEERWLNEMSATGWQMVSAFMGWYTFKAGEPDEYIYRLEFLPERASAFASQNYLRFMDESGVEIVATWHRWVYFRRKASEGPFQIYSDKASLLKHLTRIFRFFLLFACIYTPLAIMYVCEALAVAFGSTTDLYSAPTRLFLVAGYCVPALAFTLAALNVRRRIRRIKREIQLRE